jgi:cobalt-zinc-cadmium efflux system membrane fusion protein
MKNKKNLMFFIIALMVIALSAGFSSRVESARETENKKHVEHSHDDHEKHREEATHGEHEGHDDHDDEGGIQLSHGELEEFEIELAEAVSGTLDLTIELPGEIALNADRLAHVVPRVAGIVREVKKRLGDSVKAGEVMAVLESREVAEAKSAYLAALERLALARSNFQREEMLWQKKISSEQEYLNARQALAETQIEKRLAEHKLHVLGFSEESVSALPRQSDTAYTQYKIVAPFSGTVIEKHITFGEAVREDSDVFVVADLTSVWADISVYQKHLAVIDEGQKVIIEIGHGIPFVEGKISYVGPLIGKATRTALARVILPNPDGRLRPGIFITAKVAVDSVKAPIVIPKSALQTVDGKTVVFVKHEEKFEPQPVKLGRRNTSHVEIAEGLEAGTWYVSRGAFTLKAQMSKGAFGDAHNH